MNDSWCPMQGKDQGCKSDGAAIPHCEFHLCPMIAPHVLRAIREEATAPLESAIEGWRRGCR